jgi:signal transduction histidine kinase
MKRPRVRVGTALLGVLLLGLLLQWAVFVPLFARTGALPWMVLISALIACIALGRKWLGWALEPIAAQDAELRQLLSELAPEGGVPGPPRVARAAPPSVPGLFEMEQFGRRLQARLGERRELERQLEEATAYKQGFLKAVRHELRTPLNSILGFAEVLLSDLEGPLTTGQRENLTVIRRTGKRLQDLFDEVIELASVSAGPHELLREPVDAPALLEQVGEALEEERGDKPVHIRLEAGDGLPQVAGDAARLRQLLRGMASHALSVSTGELIVLAARAGDGKVVLTVSDPARRLSSADVSQLLARESAVSRRKGLDEGSRLRMAIWQELAALYGGKLSLQSDATGTELRLTLPAWSAS